MLFLCLLSGNGRECNSDRWPFPSAFFIDDHFPAHRENGHYGNWWCTRVSSGKEVCLWGIYWNYTLRWKSTTYWRYAEFFKWEKLLSQALIDIWPGCAGTQATSCHAITENTILYTIIWIWWNFNTTDSHSMDHGGVCVRAHAHAMSCNIQSLYLYASPFRGVARSWMGWRKPW